MTNTQDKAEDLALGRRKTTSKTETGEIKTQIKEDIKESPRMISTASVWWAQCSPKKMKREEVGFRVQRQKSDLKESQKDEE